MEYLSEKKRLHKFQELFLQASEICLAVSYIRDSGVKIIKPLLNEKQSIKILLDTKMNISEKHALKNLMYNGVQLKTYHGLENYHPKVFLFRIHDAWHAIIGSMNLTRGGLIENIEYGVFVSDESVNEPKNWFDSLWMHKNSKLIDEEFIDSMPVYDYRRLPKKKVLDLLKYEAREEQTDIGEIKKFILCWANDTEKDGQSMRKNGWRFRPAQDKIDEKRLIAYKKILQEGNTIELTTEFCKRVYSKYITLKRKEHTTSLRDIFIRRDKNYMEKLGIIEYKHGIIELSPLGEKYIQTEDAELKFFLIKALTEFTWFNIPIKEILFEILEYTEKWIGRDEFLLFVKHAGITDYTCHTSYDIAKLILAFRKLPETRKQDLYNFAKKNFEATDESRTQSSWPNMEGNGVKNLIEDFCSFDEVVFQDEKIILK